MTADRTPVVTGRNPPVRVDWVDYAKGICIVMVVMMHSVLGVELAAGQTGFTHPLVAFAKPFRMPDFFLISGLFLPLVIDRDWRTYLDRKVVHFAYFYVLWVTIQFTFKAPAAFFLPMAATRTLLLRSGFIPDVGIMSLVVTLVALVGALAIWRVALKMVAHFLFERPDAFWIAPKKAGAALQAAE